MASDFANSQEVPLNPISAEAALPTYMKGVHLSGAEYNEGPTGTLGTTYVYPTTEEFDYYKSKGFSIIRLAFDSAKVQPTVMQALNQKELANITTLVEYAREKGLYVILDPHNYGKMWGNAIHDFGLIGGDSISNCDFANFWQRLATVYQKYPNIIYGLENEPNEQTPTQWKASAIAAINAIRTVSKTQVIFIPGSNWTTAANWVSSGNAAAWTGYKDPAGGPFMFEMHQYLDFDYSGTHNTCASGYGSTVLTAATSWLVANGYKAFLGEFGWYNVGGVVSSACQTEGTALLDAMASHSEQWAAWTWCCSGPWAGNNGVNLDPGADGKPGDQPQTVTLLKYIP
jgi:endoglucanase